MQLHIQKSVALTVDEFNGALIRAISDKIPELKNPKFIGIQQNTTPQTKTDGGGQLKGYTIFIIEEPNIVVPEGGKQ
jgi:hypothetical protein